MKHLSLQYAGITLFMAVCLLISCKPKPYFEAKKDVNPAMWAYVDTLDFHFEITDTSKRYRMDLQLTWADTFRSQNLYLKLGTKFPTEGKYLQVVRSYDLYDPTGASAGKCSGGACSADFTMQEITKFGETGTYHFTVAQNMRVDSLSGVQGVGLRLSEIR
jgi:gliding motility-associated lipoprotein GldH